MTVRALLTGVLVAMMLASAAAGARADGPSSVVAGCVTAPGAVPAGSTVVFERAGETRSVPVDGDGCYRVELTGGRWTVRVGLPSGTRLRLLDPERKGFARELPVVDVAPGWSTTAPELQLTDRAELSGRVTDDIGAPLTPFIWIVGTGGGGANAFQDADGRWQALVDPGEYRVKFSPPSGRWMSRWLRGPEMPSFAFGGPGGETVAVGHAEAVGGLDAVLSRTATVGGRLVSSLGLPLADVEVQLLPEAPGVNVTTATTGPDGRYAFQHVLPGRHQVHFATKETVPVPYGGEGATAEQRTITVGVGAVLTDVDAVSLVGGALSGRVVDSQGRPAPDIYLSTIGGTLPTIGRGLDAVTGPDGTFHSGHVLRPGTFLLRAMGSVHSDWQPTVLRVGNTPVTLTSTPPLRQSGIEIVMYRIGEPLPPGIQSVSPDLLFGNGNRPAGTLAPSTTGGLGGAGPATLTVKLPVRCTTGCAVDVTARTPRRASHSRKPARWLVGRGRMRPGAKRVRLRLTPAGRAAVRRRSLRVRASVRPATGRARSFPLRLERVRR